MDRRTYLATSVTVSLTGCLGGSGSDDPPDPGDVECADDLQSDSSNNPGDGVWPTHLYDMQNTGQTDAPGPSGCVETQWMISPDSSGQLSTGPAVANGCVYVSNEEINDTWFSVHNARTGEQLWEYSDTDYEQILPWHAPTIVDDRLYLADANDIACVDLQNRSTEWVHDPAVEGEKRLGPLTPRIINETLYIGLKSGFVLALNAATGERIWTYNIEGLSPDITIEEDSDTQPEARRRGKVYSAIAATPERVFVSSWDLSLYALNAATGERLWEFSPGIGHLNMMEAPTVVDGRVYTQTMDAILYVLDAETGELLWTYDEYGESSDGISPIVDEDSVYIIAGTSTENLFLISLDRADGSVQWERQFGPPFVDPAADTDTIYIDLGRDLYAIDKTTGEPKWTLRLSRALAAPPAISDEAVFLADDSHLYGLW